MLLSSHADQGRAGLSEAGQTWLDCPAGWETDAGNGITFYNLLIVGSKVKVRCGDKREGEVLTLLVSGEAPFCLQEKTEGGASDVKKELGSRARELVFTGHEFPSYGMAEASHPKS